MRRAWSVYVVRRRVGVRSGIVVSVALPRAAADAVVHNCKGQGGQKEKESPEGLSVNLQMFALAVIHERRELLKL